MNGTQRFGLAIMILFGVFLIIANMHRYQIVWRAIDLFMIAIGFVFLVLPGRVVLNHRG